MSVNRFEEYKLFVEDTARFTDRRQTANNIYVAANSAVLAAAALLVKDAGLLPFWRTLTLVLVLAAGIVICVQWAGLIGDKLREKRICQMARHQLNWRNDNQKAEKSGPCSPAPQAGTK
jgi:hypothetical protein